MRKYTQYSQEFVQEIASQLNGKTRKEIMKLYGLTKNGLDHIIKKYKLKGIALGCANIPPASLPPEKELAYLCGLVATDGCITKTGEIDITLQDLDRKTVEWFASKLSTNKQPRRIDRRHEPGRSNNQVHWNFRVRNPLILNYLTDLGITSAKTFTLCPKLEGKSDEFLLYFFRGVIDGDGGIYFRNDFIGGLCLAVSSASLQFLQELQKIFGGNIRKGTKSVYILEFVGSCTKTILSYLPIDDFTMERKTKLINKALELPWIPTKCRQLQGSLWDNAKLYPQPIDYTTIYKTHENPAVSYKCFFQRVRSYGWDFERALTTPARALKPS